MVKRSLLSAIGCFISVLILFAGSNDYTTDNMVIVDQISVFTIHEKNGAMTDVTEECTTTYTANRVDDTAIEVVMYNSDIVIDKASAPGTKPYYGSWEDEDAFYSGARICGMAIPVKAGKTVKSFYKRTFKKPEQFCNFIIPSSYFKIKSDYIIKVPAALAEKIKVEGFNLAEGMKLTDKKESDGSVMYTLNCVGVKPWHHEYGAPSASMAAPQLVIKGVFDGVGQLYDYFKGFVDKDDLGDAEVRKVASLLKAKCDSPMALVDSTAQWVRRNIRYLAVEHGEYAFRPFSSSEVLAHKAGDCKGSANLIKTLLRLNGLDGRLVWVGTKGDIPFDWDSVPALCSGNHVVAACVLPDTIVYLDGTVSWASPGYVPQSIRSRRVIIEDRDSYILTNVPDVSRSDDSEKLSAEFVISASDLIGKVRMELQGNARSSFMHVYSGRQPKDRNMICAKLLRYPRKNSEVDDISLEFDYTRPDVLLSGTVTEKNAVKTVADKMYIDLKPVRCSELETIELKNRKRDYFNYSEFNDVYTYSLEIPEGWVVETVPPELNISNEWYDAYLIYKVSEDGRKIVCSSGVKASDFVVPVDRIQEFNNLVKSIRKASDSQIVLKKSNTNQI